MNDNLDWKNLNKFQDKMISILKEKFEKYENTWKNTKDIFNLKNKLINQLETLRLNNLRYKSDKRKAKRKLIHIANYSYFLYTLLNNNKF